MIFIGVPWLNRRDLLDRCLSCLDVSHELFIVDNSKENRGVPASWNLILNEAFIHGYDWAFIGSNDCFLAPGSLAAAVAVLGTEGVGIWHLHAMNFWAISRETVDRVGWFDENFWPAYHEDQDYHYRMKLAGIGRRNVLRASAEHLGSQTIAAGYECRNNDEYYRRKWGGDPGQERFLEPFGALDLRGDRRQAAMEARRR